jgi:hypothetical protein
VHSVFHADGFPKMVWVAGKDFASLPDIAYLFVLLLAEKKSLGIDGYSGAML